MHQLMLHLVKRRKSKMVKVKVKLNEKDDLGNYYELNISSYYIVEINTTVFSLLL